ncbi:hypothetical protein [Petrachloros mirabilis]
MSKIWIPVVAALVGGVVMLFASQLEVFSRHRKEIERLNDELFLRSRVKVYVDFMKDPSEQNRRNLILVGSDNVVKASGELYSKFCKKEETRDDGKKVLVCENTCPENRAFIKLYQAMRNDFQVTRMSPVSDEDLYVAKYDKKPECPPQ